MMKIILVSLAVLGVVLAETRFEKVPFGSVPYSNDVNSEVSHPEPVIGLPGMPRGLRSIPPDNGGNFGDNIWRDRQSGDVRLTHEIQVPPKSGGEQQFNWTGNFAGKSITSVRILNMGRQHCWVDSISGNGGSSAVAVVKQRGNEQCRLVIEVYGR